MKALTFSLFPLLSRPCDCDSGSPRLHTYPCALGTAPPTVHPPDALYWSNTVNGKIFPPHLFRFQSVFFPDTLDQFSAAHPPFSDGTFPDRTATFSPSPRFLMIEPGSCLQIPPQLVDCLLIPAENPFPPLDAKPSPFTLARHALFFFFPESAPSPPAKVSGFPDISTTRWNLGSNSKGLFRACPKPLR